MKKIFFLGILSILLFSCKRHNKVQNVERAFYYWKNNQWGFTEKEDTLIKKQEIQKIYTKFFEVEHNEVMGNIPVAKSRINLAYYKHLTLVPTVYIRNEVFLKSSKGSLDTLADNVNFLITKYYKGDQYDKPVNVSEFQMDCDWTLKSKDNYFYFLKKLKIISKKQISCTLRLYPYKYPEKMGIPPVDKVTLMCYNLVNPLESHNKNSILDVNELSSYLNKERKYPIHLDIALPIYSWMQVYQNNQFSKVIYNADEITKIKSITKNIEPLWYEVLKDTVADDFYLRIGDKIKYEEITADKIYKAIDIIKKNVMFDKNTTITLFHLDDQQLNQYSDEEISRFYSDFSK